MSAGFKYDLVPPVEQEERYDVQTGIRRRGPFKLDTQNLVVGSFLPRFTPICADLKNKGQGQSSRWMRGVRSMSTVFPSATNMLTP